MKLVIESELLSIRKLLVKFALKIGQEKYFIINSMLKTNPWIFEIKYLTEKKLIGSFYGEDLLQIKL